MRRYSRRLATFLSALVLTLSILMIGVTPALAAPAGPDSTQSPIPVPVHTYRDIPTAKYTTPADAAYTEAKQQLSNEYNSMMQGKESQAVYEAHMTAFMVKYHLGNATNLHNVLMKVAKRNKLNALSASLPSCPSIAQMPSEGVTPAVLCPTYAAQFPEEQWYWCGPATMSTTLVEDSFTYSGTTSYYDPNARKTVTLTYNPYVTSQSYTTAYNDENALTPYLIPAGWQATGPTYMLNTANDFINGKGGWYALVWGNGSFQSNVNYDIGTGWDIPTGISIPTTQGPTLPGYPYPHSAFDHWVPVTWINGSTIYYADPTYNAPNYTAAQGWTTPGPYASTDVNNMAQYVSSYIW